MLSAGNQLLAIIDDLLDITAIEANRTLLEPSHFSLLPVINEVRNTLELDVTDNHNEFVIDNQLRDDIIFGDFKRVRQALINVVSNANKFTQNGKVTVTLKPDDNDADNWVCVEITDTGIGMNDEQVQYIFEAFTQGDSGLSRKFGGTGIGLNLTSRLWSMMGGTIEVNSQLGQGSSFRLLIPRVGQAQPKAA